MYPTSLVSSAKPDDYRLWEPNALRLQIGEMCDILK